MNEKSGNATTKSTAGLKNDWNFIAKQKEKLEREKILLIEERESLINPRKVSYNFEGDPAWETKIRRIGDKLNAIEIALLRIKNGVYTICIICGNEIERRSLEICSARRICCGCIPPEPPKKRRRF